MYDLTFILHVGPVCRYELETDDAAYERDRRSRMLKRKMRLRMDELKAKKVSQLRDIAACLLVNTVHCIDKDEIIERLLASGRIEIIEGAPTIVKTREEFEAMGVGELRRLLLSFGLSDQGALEKSEFRLRLLDSGRIELLDSTGSSSESNSNSYWNRNASLASVSHDMRYGSVARSEESKSSSGLSSNFFDNNEKDIYDEKYDGQSDQKCHRPESSDMGGGKDGPMDVSNNGLDTRDNNSQPKNYTSHHSQPAEGKSTKEKIEEKVEEKIRERAIDNTSYSYRASPASTIRTDITSFLTSRSSSNNVSQPKAGGKQTAMGEREVRAMSVTELKALSLSLAVNLANCLYKDDIVDRLVASGKIQAATNTAGTI
jgi:hypothetical protein